ncbi:MAG: HdeD family acid-resistance protein [Pirellulales bacterium]|nr:HdeD family acid-resistance protein [Pirellulales bacterium]
MSTGSMDPQTNLGLDGLGEFQKSWGWLFALGVCMVGLGIAAIWLPIVATLTIEIIVGWLLIIGGIIHAINAFSAKQWGGSLMNVLAALLYGVVGVLMLGHPIAGELTLTLILAAFFLVEGVFKIIMSLQMRSSMPNWGWMLTSGLIALLLGAMIWVGWPATAAWVIGLLVGIDLIFGGWAMLFIALAVKNTTPTATA